MRTPQRASIPERRPTIRKVLIPLLAVFMAMAVLVAASPVDAASRKVKLGIAMTAGNHSIAPMDQIQRETGRYPAIWGLWSTWGNDNKPFPSAMVAQLKARDAVPMIFWEPVRQAGQCSDHSRLRKIARGKFDKYIRSWGQAARKSNTMVLVRFAHEINGRYFPWTVGKCGNTIKHYKAAWRHVHNIVRNKVGAKNVKFLWSVAKKSAHGGNPYKKFYPGNKYVQYAGFSSFNWGSQGNWTPMAKSVGNVMRWFKRFTRKPVIIAELGSNKWGGPTGNPAVDKPTWIRSGYKATYKKYPQIKAIVYLNENLRNVGHPDWSLDDPGQSMDAYTDVVNDPRFQGHF